MGLDIISYAKASKVETDLVAHKEDYAKLNGINDGVVSPRMTNFMVRSKNLFNGKYVNGYMTSATQGGILRYRSLVAGDDSKIAIIQIEANRTYTVKIHNPEKSNRFRVAINDTEPVFGSFKDTSTTIINDDVKNEVTFTNTETGRFLMIQVSTGTEPKMQVEEGSIASKYEDYYILSNDHLEKNNEDMKIKGEDISNSLKLPINLYDHTKSLEGYVFAPTTGQPTAMSGFFLSDYIPITSGKVVTLSNGNIANTIALYDINKQFLTKLSGDFTGIDKPLTKTIAEANTAFMRVNIKLGGVPQGEYMIVEGSEIPREYIPYGEERKYKVPWLKIEEEQIEKISSGKWYGKDLYLFGDSITYWDQRPGFQDPEYWIIGYATYIREQLGANVINKGRQGATLAVKEGVPSINTIIKQTDLTTAYAILITGGTNDNGNSIPHGELGDRKDTVFDTSTFIGALRDAIHYAYEQNPLIKIYLMTPNQGRVFHYQTYNDDMKAIAKMYGLPLIDINECSQINAVTAYTLLFDGAHPNNDGYKVMADVIVPFLANH